MAHFPCWPAVRAAQLGYAEARHQRVRDDDARSKLRGSVRGKGEYEVSAVAGCFLIFNTDSPAESPDWTLPQLNI